MGPKGLFFFLKTICLFFDILILINEEQKMNWFTKFYLGVVKAFRVEEKPKLPNHGANWDTPYGARQTYSAMTALSAFGGHGYTHAAVCRSSQDLAALPIKLLKGKGSEAEEVMESEFLDLMHEPSTNVDSFLFREQIAADLMLSGNCYVVLIGVDSVPSSIVRLHPDEVEIQTDRSGIIGYIHTSGGESVVYKPNRVIHLRGISYATGPSGLYGTGIIEPLNLEINSDINAMKLASDASSKGRPDVLLSPKDETDIWGYERRKEILDQYNGLSKVGGAMVLSGMIDVTELKLSPRDVEYEKARVMARESISAVAGVPPSILGLPTANYATSRQEALNYWEMQQKKGARFEWLFTKIAKLYNDEYEVKIDYSGIEVLQAKRDSQLSRIEQHILNGISAEDAYAYENLMDAPIGERNNKSIKVDDEESIDQVLDIGKYRQLKGYSDLSETVKNGLKNKAAKHNEMIDEKGMADWRKVRAQTLGTVFERGVGAYNTNPDSVRPSVSNADQWAYARVNSFLYALRSDRFRSGRHDTDLLPEEHPLTSKPKKKRFRKRNTNQ
mgnify:CR=1 FL=1|tara:strand:- start:3345 stop:5018 length:1674 start_codon:yes stop_codon:yes gene_type:complete